jgi:transcriptional regulator with XRE-family HTH domain
MTRSCSHVAALASLAGNRLCEYEKWPHSERRPSVYVLVMLAHIYQAGVLDLLDLADHEHLPPRDRLTLLQPGQTAASEAGVSTPTGACSWSKRSVNAGGRTQRRRWAARLSGQYAMTATAIRPRISRASP